MKNKFAYVYSTENGASEFESATRTFLLKTGVVDPKTVLDRFNLEDPHEFEEFRSLVESGVIGVVATYSLLHHGSSALSLERFIRFVAFLFEHNVRFLSFSDEIDSDSPTSVFVTSLVRGIENARKKTRSAKIRKQISLAKAAGLLVGRPRRTDDAKIARLRARGLSIRKIAEELAISKGAVQHSLQRNKGVD